MPMSFEIKSIGRIRNRQSKAWIEVDDPYRDAIKGLAAFSHIYVLYWLHENDTPEKRGVLLVHPRKDARNPLTGVFATHSPLRPNLIALTRCRIQGIEGCIIYIDEIDARDNSPLIDIKCYIPPEDGDAKVRIPDWVGNLRTPLPVDDLSKI